MAKFVKVKCKCGAEKVVFDHSSRRIKCSCGELLVAPTGGKSVVLAETEEELD